MATLSMEMVTARLDELGQSVIQLRGDAATTAVSLKDEIQKMTDQFALKMAEIDNKGATLLNDTSSKFEDMFNKLQALHDKT